MRQGRGRPTTGPLQHGAASALWALQRALLTAGRDKTAAAAASGFVSPGKSRELDFSSPPAPVGKTQSLAGAGRSPHVAPAPAAPHAVVMPPPATPQCNHLPPSAEVWRSPRNHPAPAPFGAAVPYARPEPTNPIGILKNLVTLEF